MQPLAGHAVHQACSFAVPCHRRAFNRVLRDWPDAINELDRLLRQHPAFEGCRCTLDMEPLMHPPVARTLKLLPYEAPADPARFTL